MVNIVCLTALMAVSVWQVLKTLRTVMEVEQK